MRKSKQRTRSMYPHGVSFVSMQLLIKGGTTKEMNERLR